MLLPLHFYINSMSAPLYTLLATTPKGFPSRDPRKALLCLLFVCVCPRGFSLSLLSSFLYGAEALPRLTLTTSTRRKWRGSYGGFLILHFYIFFYVSRKLRGVIYISFSTSPIVRKLCQKFSLSTHNSSSTLYVATLSTPFYY